jgi:hypothetical protein
MNWEQMIALNSWLVWDLNIDWLGMRFNSLKET